MAGRRLRCGGWLVELGKVELVKSGLVVLLVVGGEEY